MIEFIIQHKIWFIYGSLPIISAFIGWVTNVLAIKMTFYPFKFWGIPPYLGWQGIIPRKSYKMASKGADLITGRLLKTEELFERPDPHVMTKTMASEFEETTTDVVQNIAESAFPGLYEKLPEAVKEAIQAAVRSQLPELMQKSLQEIKQEILLQMDIKSIMLKNLTGENVKHLVELFQRAGDQEFRFIEKTGLYLGFFLGIFQAIIWHYYNEAWTLPVIGVVVGYVTNWLALQMIFRPLREKKYLFFRYQGLFLRRQKEVSKAYASLVAEKVLSPKNILRELTHGRYASRLMEIVRKNILLFLDSMEQVAKPIITWILGKENYAQLRSYIVERMVAVVPVAMQKTENYLADTLQLEKTLYEKLSSLEPEEFEDILRSAFREDEIILILVGAFLGALIGFLQIFLLT